MDIERWDEDFLVDTLEEKYPPNELQNLCNMYSSNWENMLENEC